MSDKKKKFDEQTLARVLEAAYILQEHQNELEEFKSGLELRRKETGAELAPVEAATSPSPVTSPAASVSPFLSPPAASTIFSASEVSAPVASAASSPAASAAAPFSATMALPAPPASSPIRILEAVPEKSGDSILAQVMDTQDQIESKNLDLDAAMALVAEQVIEICGAAGAEIAIVTRRLVCYRSVAGIRTLAAGSEVTLNEALCAPCLQSGEVWRCADTNSEDLHREECRHRGIGSLIAAPLFHEGRSVGALELLFSDAGAFTETDVQACQLMAGIITDSLSRDPGLRWKVAPAAKAAEMDDSVLAEEAAKEHAAAEATESYQCKCGHVLLAGEQFCGKCGTPRAGDYEPASMQSKVASLWHMQEAMKPEPLAHMEIDELPAVPGPDAAQMRIRTSILSLTDRSKRATVPHFGLHDDETNQGAEPPQPAASIESSEAKAASEIDVPATRTNKALEELLSPATPARADWSSATSARDFLEQVADGTPQNALLRLWNTHRGDIYLAIAVILVLCVIRWGMWSNHPASPQPSPTPAPASSVPHKTAEPDLPLSERMLIAMGLAEAPEPPADKGNPSTQVWVDLHTALYYCPGADLYGKTATGKYTTQREAELDQFQPAYRKTCN